MKSYCNQKGHKNLKIKVIALLGEAGSGKDSLLQRVIASHPNYKELISHTTRPPREGEVEGKNYYYVTQKEFLDLIQNGQMLEYAQFNGWFYGTSISAFDKDKINIGVFNQAGIKTLLSRDDIELKVFYIFADPAVRLIRQLTREKNPNINEILRRYKTDLSDFQHLDFDHTVIDNSNSMAVALQELEDKIAQLDWS